MSAATWVDEYEPITLPFSHNTNPTVSENAKQPKQKQIIEFNPRKKLSM